MHSVSTDKRVSRVTYNIGGLLTEIVYPEQLLIPERLKSFKPFIDKTEEEITTGNAPRCKTAARIVMKEAETLNRQNSLSSPFLLSTFETESGVCSLYREEIPAYGGGTGNESNTGYLFITNHKDTEKENRSGIRVTMNRENKDVICEYKEQLSYANLVFSLWMIYAFGAIKSQTVPIHSSAVISDGKAVLFLGESGTGKSTQASFWMDKITGTIPLNDDSPVVTLSDRGEVYTCGSPWSGKGKIYINKKYPVAAFVRIEQHSGEEIVRMGKLEAFAALYPSFPPQFIKDEWFEDKACAMISEIIKAVPIYRLRCRAVPESAILAHSVIFENKD